MVTIRQALPAGHDDLHVYLLAVRAVSGDVPLYEVRAPNGDPFTYPPFAVLAMWPTSWMSQRWADALWTVGTVVVLALMVVVLAWPKRTEWSRPAWLTVVAASFMVLLLSTPALLNLDLGQLSAMIVLLVLLDLLNVTPPPIRGACLGIAAALKLTPLVLVLCLLICGRARDGRRALATFTCCTLLAALVLPTASLTYWTSAVFQMEGRLGYLDYVDNQSLQGFLLRSSAPAWLVSITWLAGAAAIVLFSLYQAKILRRTGDEVYGFLAVACATLVASPISWGHHLFWVVLAGLWLLWSTKPAPMLLGTAVLANMLIWPDLALSPDAHHTLSGAIAINSRGIAALLLASGLLLLAARTNHDPAGAGSPTHFL